MRSEQDPAKEIWKIKDAIDQIYLRFGPLTPKQLQVLLTASIAFDNGTEIGMIADDLKMSDRSVKVHIRNINKILGSDKHEIITMETRLTNVGNEYTHVSLTRIGKSLIADSVTK